MNRAVVLGSGTSNGVPMLGIEYPTDFLSNPKNWRTRCSLLLMGPDGNVLVDCAPEMRIQLLAAKCRAVDAVIITHTHADHVMGMDDLRSFCIVHRKAIPVYTLHRYQQDIKRIFAYAFEDHPAGVEVPKFDLRDVPEVVEVAGLAIETFVVDHGAIPVVGLRVANFAYLTDVSRIPHSVMPKLAGLDTLILDAVRYQPHPNHFHFDAALEVAKRIGAGVTYLTHLSHDYDHDSVESTLPPGIRLAFDGLEIDF